MKNIFIEGENLEVLKVLQKIRFQVKNDLHRPALQHRKRLFYLPDKFSETKEYKKRVGDKDEVVVSSEKMVCSKRTAKKTDNTTAIGSI